MDMQTETALGSFRKYLLKLKPTGPKGFEGLVADAMANLTGLVIRLAKAGLQGGVTDQAPRTRPSRSLSRVSSTKRISDLRI